MNDRRYKTIYELLWNSDEDISLEFKNSVNMMIDSLPSDIYKYILLAYGSDLENPVRSSLWNDEYSKYFHSYIVPRLRARLNNPEGRFSTNLLDRNNTKLELGYLFKVNINNFSDLEYLFSARQIVIIDMFLGFNGDRYRIKEIAKSLNVTSLVVMNELKDICNKCKEYFQIQQISKKR